MLTIRSILVPVDFTETSDRALDYAVAMAARFEATVVAMHAYEIPVYGFPDGALVASGEVATRISEAAQKALDRLVEARQNKGVKLTALLRTGVAYDLANTVADEIDADLIVIGTHGRRGLARALLGSVAENVIRTAKRPVLVIHGPRD
ncbi:MAG: Universal stress protein UspA [Myxococcaceae bacterium]|jgi:nucleotide-binding universal stress UspA family protein|nr:Universal stress protein UspA [Myxococcaceae bacterium]